MRRAKLGESIGLVKGDGRANLRPEREAQILRRLASRHEGRFPLPSLMRVWREIFAALTRIQGAFAVAVHAPDDQRDLWDIARDHYGSATPVSAMNAPTPALRAVIDGTAKIGRASWRERVCQYVYVSVVADTLKKKKK